MKRRGDREREPMPAWVTAPSAGVECQRAHEWAWRHGYSDLEWLIARATAKRAAYGLDNTTPRPLT